MRTPDLNVAAISPLPAPAELLATLPRTPAQADFVAHSRQTLREILFGDDPRLLAIVGPCSIHDVAAAREYARRLADLAYELDDRIVIVMRAYFEKPRTVGGWKGLLLDPHLDGSGDIARGLQLARGLLRDILDLGLPTATEFLDPVSPQYLADLVCWTAVGARTAESQPHRQLASALPMPIGFKNSTDGNLRNAVHGIKAAAQRHTYFGLTADGRSAAIHTRGNPDCHLVLRGGSAGPNYSAEHLVEADVLLAKAGLHRTIMVDCSHDNSGRVPERQPRILADVTRQILAGRTALRGVMLESNLFAGNQPHPPPTGPLRYGVSITDACMDWSMTQQCLRAAYRSLAPRFVSAPAPEPAFAK
ncbi:3-deoxy-7-phosphoheptulonate synthase [Opitutus terrae]|uniref:Phospho-2-dehydro-3-deoxyheptonate aldolase n=1 Tax=Opitutus terrae (strain DSM 11246 / JCM 15787 / PB90-1) TaxID=452637 RepID=B1ZPP9_OPITP|nr:3-deoxy-7-phosphoheptulonate synthase [Opitutus terrae]ACB75502.1 phospho-2-dehydro-3-deoxyheptonate aldolase [Opitutus terrae PB90-1]